MADDICKCLTYIVVIPSNATAFYIRSILLFQIIFIYISELSERRRVDEPVGRIAVRDISDLLAVPDFSDLVRFLIGLSRSKRKILINSLYSIQGICDGVRAACHFDKVILVDVTVLAQGRSVNISVFGISGGNIFYRLAKVDLSDFV